MSRLVVDADVISFLFKNHPIAKLYDSELLGHTLMLSFMTLAELDRWVIQRKWGEARRTWLNRYLDTFVVIPYHRALCTKWAEVTVGAQARGYRIEYADAWIASTALLYDIPLVTHNGGDYRGVPGLTLISHRS
jgi:tRNA(fMet)-specific endonuclease VapC